MQIDDLIKVCNEAQIFVDDVSRCVSRIRKGIAELTQPSHNTGSPKLPPCGYCSKVDTLERIGGWLERGYMFCPYCGRKLSAV